MIYSLQEQVDLLLNDDETGLIGFKAWPVCRAQYDFLCYKKQDGYWLLSASQTPKEWIAFAKGFVSGNVPYSVFLSEIAYSEKFVAAYKRRFCRSIHIDDKSVIQLIDKACSIDLEADYSSAWGLDGFALDCHICGQAHQLCMWCVYDDYRLTPLASLVNLFLDYVHADPSCRLRFRQPC